MDLFKKILGIFLFINLLSLTASSQNAQLQVIHNSADTGLQTIDVYIDGTLMSDLDNIGFREATGLLSIPANSTLDIGIAHSGSQDASDTFANFHRSFSADSHVLILSGVRNPANYADNPDGINTKLNVYTKKIRIGSHTGASDINIMTFHGATDFQYFDGFLGRLEYGQFFGLFENVGYGQFSEYASFPANNNNLFDFTDSSNSGFTYTGYMPFNFYFNNYNLDFRNAAAVMFVSGFRDSTANNKGRDMDVILAFPTGLTLQLFPYESSNVQFVNNSPDPALNRVDIYVNGNLAVDNLSFRDATNFQAYDIGSQESTIGIAPHTSNTTGNGYADTFRTFERSNLALTNDIEVVTGLLDSTQFELNPEGLSTSLQLRNIAGRTTGIQGDLAINMHNGLTDAPSLDIEFSPDLNQNFTILDNFFYNGALADYTVANSQNYTISVYDSFITSSNPQSATKYLEFQAGLSFFTDTAMCLFLSGFLNKADNNFDYEAQMLAVFPNGNTIVFNKTFDLSAQVDIQFIHNSPDPALDTVDIYINGNLEVDDLTFRNATSFLDLEIGNERSKVGIAPYTSNTSGNGYDDTLITFEREFTEHSHYVNVINGVGNTSEFSQNPDGFSTGLRLHTSAGLDDSQQQLLVNFNHGVPDAPFMDLQTSPDYMSNDDILDNLIYGGSFVNYINFDPQDYTFTLYDSIRSSSPQSSSKYYEFHEDLSQYQDSNMFVIVSGFFDPKINDNGPGVQMVGVFPNGDTVVFNRTFDKNDQARMQFIHNSPDPSLDSVDIYLNGNLQVDNLTFRNATAYHSFQIGDQNWKIGLAPYTSNTSGNGYNDTLTTFDRQVQKDSSYISIINGVNDTSAFAQNPDGISTMLSLNTISGMMGSQQQMMVNWIHGVPDASFLDIETSTAYYQNDSIFNNLMYKASTGYKNFNAGNYTFTVYDSSRTTSSATRFYEFEEDLSSFADSAMLIFVSGFDSYYSNPDRPNVQLIGALPNGDTILFGKNYDHNNTSSIPEMTEEASIVNNLFPNPAQNISKLEYQLTDNKAVSITLFDNTGKEIRYKDLGIQSAGVHETNIEVKSLDPGLYHLEFKAGNNKEVLRLMVVD